MSAEQDRGQTDGSSLDKPISRRVLLKGAAGLAGAAATGGAFAGDAAQAKTVAAESPPPLRFLTQFEFDYVTAMAETIWPTDDLGPGARVGGVGQYIDGQLAGSWGQGREMEGGDPEVLRQCRQRRLPGRVARLPDSFPRSRFQLSRQIRSAIRWPAST